MVVAVIGIIKKACTNTFSVRLGWGWEDELKNKTNLSQRWDWKKLKFYGGKPNFGSLKKFKT